MKIISDLVSDCMAEISGIGLSDSSVSSYYSSCFKPVIEYCEKREINYYSNELASELVGYYDSQFEEGIISRRTKNRRIRGINIISEVYETGSFNWKVCLRSEHIPIGQYSESLVNNYLDQRELCAANIRFEKNILSRLVQYLEDNGVNELSGMRSENVVSFINMIAFECPHSMDKVLTALSKFFIYLCNAEILRENYSTLVKYAHPRMSYVHKPMNCEEIEKVLKEINRSCPAGKRDYAVILLAVKTGLRAGDIANLKLTDIDYIKGEARITQGKTKVPLTLPLDECVLGALADYILNGRPSTDDEKVFIRSLAPYTGFKDGVSIAHIFRRRLDYAGIIHEKNDGRTFHGIRRMIGTQMVSHDIPVTTVAQVLGHQSITPTRQYISLDTEGLKKCLLPMSTLDELL